MIANNPWQVDSIDAFYFLKCLECEFDTQKEPIFHHHAIENHPLSFVLFGKSELEIDTKNEIVSNPPNSPEPDVQENTFEWLPAEEKQIKVKKKRNKILGKKKLDKTKAKIKQKYLLNSTDNISEDCNDSLEVKLEYDDNETSTIANLNETKHETDELKQEEPPNIPFYKSKSTKCKFCQSDFKSKFALTYHIKTVHKGKKPLQCSICSYACLKPYDMNIHISAVHERKKPYKCTICDNSFGLKRNLKSHIASVHEGKKSFQCNVCGAMFSEKHGLKLHIITVHEGKKLNKCPECDQSFGLKSNLTKHISTVHEGKKAFQCDLCGSRFSQKGSLKAHISAVHEKKKPFKCDIDGAAFATKKELKRHVDAVHEKKKPYNCHLCETGFPVKKSLLRHIESFHQGTNLIKD